MTLLNFLVGCRHAWKSRVFRNVRRDRSGRIVWRGETYRVCLDCGREIPYDWEHMGSVKEQVAGERFLTTGEI